MEQKLLDLTNNLKTISDDARNSFGQWSVAQCLDHLILTNKEFFPEMEKLCAGTRKNSFFENYSPFSGWFGRFLIKAVTEGSRPAKAPSKRIVPPSDIEAGIVDKYCEHQAEMVEKIGLTGGVDWKKTIVTSPFLRVFTYSLADAYVVLVEHSKRHVSQAKRVMETEGFPG